MTIAHPVECFQVTIQPRYPADPGSGDQYGGEARLARHDDGRCGRILASRLPLLAAHGLVQHNRTAGHQAADRRQRRRSACRGVGRPPLRRRGNTLQTFRPARVCAPLVRLQACDGGRDTVSGETFKHTIWLCKVGRPVRSHAVRPCNVDVFEGPSQRQGGRHSPAGESGWESPQFNIEAPLTTGGETGLVHTPVSAACSAGWSLRSCAPSAEWKMAIGVFAPSASGMVDFEAATKARSLPMMICRHEGYA